MAQFVVAEILRPLDRVIRFVTADQWFITVNGSEI